MAGKLGSGFTDAQLEEWQAFFNSEGANLKFSGDQPPAEWGIDLPSLAPQYRPDIWLRPQAVWEVRQKFLHRQGENRSCFNLETEPLSHTLCMRWSQVRAASLSLSPVFQPGSGAIPTLDANDNRGLSLRFPRFIRERHDKAPTEATSSEQ